MLGMIVAAFTLGLVVAIPPGPVTIATGQRAITYGFWNAFTFNLGSLTSDAFYALVTYFGLAALLADSVILQLALWTLGGAWLSYMGISAVRTHIDLNALDEQVARHTVWSNFRSGLLITLFNPLTIVAWIALAGNFFLLWNAEWPPVEKVGLLAILVMLVGTMTWVVLVAWVLSSVRRFVSPRLVRWISMVSGLLLIIYALSAWHAALDLLL